MKDSDLARRGFSHASISGTVTSGATLRAARAALSGRYPQAQFAFASGSILRGQGTVLSDIDLVVVHARLPQARRESFIQNGIPVEAFVNDHGTLHWFMREDIRRGIPSMITMVTEGIVLGPLSEASENLQAEAGHLLAAGPPPLEGEPLARLRYEITDKIDDLRGKRTRQEILAIGASLYEKLATLMLRGRGDWGASPKWIPRALTAQNETRAAHFLNGFEALFSKNLTQPLIDLAERELARHGGFLFEGYRAEADPCWRLDPPAPILNPSLPHRVRKTDPPRGGGRRSR